MMPWAAQFWQNKDSLTWFLGNTFALAAWWVLSGVIGGVVLSLAGGAVAFLMTGRHDIQKRTERIVGVVGGALVGMNGGALVGRIADFSGVLSMVYLWGFVGMAMAVFLGEARLSRPRLSSYADDAENLPDATSSLLDRLSITFSNMGSHVNGIVGTVCGAMAGTFYGAASAWVVPLSSIDVYTDQSPLGLVSAASIIWAVLGGFGGGIGGSRHGIQRGLIALLFGLLFGSAFGGLVALLGMLTDDLLSGAINGAVGGAFFGAIAVSDLLHERFP